MFTTCSKEFFRVIVLTDEDNHLELLRVTFNIFKFQAGIQGLGQLVF